METEAVGIMCSGRGGMPHLKETYFNCGNTAIEQTTYLSKNKRWLLGLLPLRLYVFNCPYCGLNYITCSSARGFRVISEDGTIMKNHPSTSFGYTNIHLLIERKEITSPRDTVRLKQ
jgi:hypothetical protein